MNYYKSIINLLLHKSIFCRSTTHGFYTDRHWRCNGNASGDWFSDLYDDSSWSNALTIPAHTDYTVEYLRENFGLYAKLLWYFDNIHQGTIYCRARLTYGKWLSPLKTLYIKYRLLMIWSRLNTEPAPFSRLMGSSVIIPEGCYSYDYGDGSYDVVATSITNCIYPCLVKTIIFKFKQGHFFFNILLLF